MIDVAGGNKVYYYHFDGLGSVRALSDEGGNIVERYSYEVFGKPAIQGPNYEPRTASDYNNRYMFTAREYDSDTSLYYYRARYYSPNIGRFLQVDPAYFTDGLNLYTYCWNNAVNFVDPYGLGVKSWVKKVWDWIVKVYLTTCAPSPDPTKVGTACLAGCPAFKAHADVIEKMCEDTAFYGTEECKKLHEIMAKCSCAAEGK